MAPLVDNEENAVINWSGDNIEIVIPSKLPGNARCL